MLAEYKIAVLDLQTIVPAGTVQDWVRAVELQINRDIASTWGVRADLVYVPRGRPPPAGYWQVLVIDNADVANALGYHDLTATGLPLGKVFVQTALHYGEQPSATLSHEVLEMLADPYVSLVVADPLNARKFWAREICDAVQDDALGYDIVLPETQTRPARAVRVSDFVLPTYFNAFWTQRPFSFRDHLAGPLPALARGGWMACVEDGIWSQVVHREQRVEGVPAQRRALLQLKARLDGPLDRRRLQRMIPKAQWVLSTA